MNDRLKNTILCALLLARKSILILIITELAAAAIMFITRGDGEKIDFVIGSDLLPVFVIMLSGMSFFERHNAFCMANAVSRRNRLISVSFVSAVMCLLVSAADKIICGVISNGWLSLAELVRTVAYRRMISGGHIFADIIEMFFFSETVFFIGYFLGGLRYSKGGTMTMITLIISAVIMYGSVFLDGIINFTPAMVIMYVPALMQRSAVTAVFLDIIIAAVLLWLSVKLSEAVIEKRRGD